MPSGQSQTTWFPELKNILKTQWKYNLNIQDHFDLMKRLNDRLLEIRKEYNVKPPTFFCKNCNGRHKGKLQMVTITSMYFALERFEVSTHEEHLELKRNWKKYSKENSINIHGKVMKKENKNTKAHIE